MRTNLHFPPGRLDELGTPLIRTLWGSRPPWASASISELDAAFFSGLVMETKPARLLEIGVASGWGSCVLLSALESAGLRSSVLYGVDIAERFFYDDRYATGQCVGEVMPDWLPRYHLTTGVTMSEHALTMGVDNLDFVFIDAHHMHPWATLDLLAAMPSVRPGAWIAMHDLNLSRKEDQNHQNRGPKYLFEGWDHDKAQSIEVPAMAGALKIGDDPSSHLPLLLDILYTPWETPLEPRVTESACAVVARNYGESWAAKYRRALEIGNYHVHKVQGPDVLQPPQSGRARWVRRLLGQRIG